MIRFPQHLDNELKNLEKRGLGRYFKSVSGECDLCSNDYLGIAQKLASISVTAGGSTGSRLISGDSASLNKLESALADFFKSDSALFYPNGYMANLGLLSAIGNRHSIFHYDSEVHASLKDGMRLSAARKIPFRHNDFEQLKQNLSAGTGDQFVVVESLYSMSGDIIDMKAILKICEDAAAFLILDEAHSTGIFGPEGSGLAVEVGLETKLFARVHTFGKAFGAQGAAVCGSSKLKRLLISRSRPLIYSTAPPASQVEMLFEALKLIRTSDQERSKLQENSISLREALVAKGFQVDGSSNSPILPLRIPGAGKEELSRLAGKLSEEGFDCRLILPPTVREGEELIRVVVHAFNKPGQLQDFVAIVAENR